MPDPNDPLYSGRQQNPYAPPQGPRMSPPSAPVTPPVNKMPGMSAPPSAAPPRFGGGPAQPPAGNVPAQPPAFGGPGMTPQPPAFGGTQPPWTTANPNLPWQHFGEMLQHFINHHTGKP